MSVLPRGWSEATLGDVLGGIEAGKSFKCLERPPEPGETGVAKVSAVSWGTYDEDESKTVREASRIDASLLIHPGDFLFSRANTIDLVGACVIAGGSRRAVMLSDKILRFRFKEVLPAYVLYYLRSVGGRSEIERLATGNQESMRNIGQERIRAIRLPVAPILEQQRIVAAIEEHLTKLDAAVAGLERARANALRYRAAVLHSAIGGTLVTPNMTPTGSAPELLHQWQASATPKDPNIALHVPVGWGSASLDALTERITSGSRDWSPYYDRGSSVFVLAQNVRPGRLDLSSVQLVDPPLGHRDKERSRIRRDDLLITIVGANTGHACRVTADLHDHFVCQSVALVRLKQPEMAPFVELYLNSEEDGGGVLQDYAYGQGRPHLSFDQLKQLPVPVPPIASQRAIVAAAQAVTSVLDRLEAQVSMELKRAARLRQAILKRAFEGRLVSQDPSDEPASELLARVRAAVMSGAVPKRPPRGRKPAPKRSRTRAK